jgi:hypothetical protein
MIHYALKCQDGHAFESWFKSASAFDALQEAGHLTCAVCGISGVTKAIMAPRISHAPEPTSQKPLTGAKSDTELALAELRRKVEENADYVGPRFAEEARAMYLGTSPERAIYGEASGAEARALIDDGVPVSPLPFFPNRKAN